MRIIAARRSGKPVNARSPEALARPARMPGKNLQDEARKLAVVAYFLRAKGPLLDDVPSTSPLLSHRLDLLWAVAGAEHCISASAFFFAAIV
jgi:hypothetical protein